MVRLITWSALVPSSFYGNPSDFSFKLYLVYRKSRVKSNPLQLFYVFSTDLLFDWSILTFVCSETNTINTLQIKKMTQPGPKMLFCLPLIIDQP